MSKSDNEPLRLVPYDLVTHTLDHLATLDCAIAIGMFCLGAEDTKSGTCSWCGREAYPEGHLEAVLYRSWKQYL